MTIDPQQPIAPVSSAPVARGQQTSRRAGRSSSVEPFAHTLRRALDRARSAPVPWTSTRGPVGTQTASLNSQNALLLDLLETLVASEVSVWSAPQNALGLSGSAGSIAGGASPLAPLMGFGFPSSSLSSLIGAGSSPLSDVGSSTPPSSPSASPASTVVPTEPSAQPSTNGATGSPAAVRTALQPLIASLAPRYGLSSQLVNALITQESGYNPTATSAAGAMGLMQLMPSTAATLGVADPYDPVANLRGGMQYLGSLLKQYGGDLPLALAAYNAGPGAVNAYGGIPPYPQTQQYVADIMSQITDSLP